MIPRVGLIHSCFGYPRRHSVCNDAIVEHLHDDFCLMISIAPLAVRPGHTKSMTAGVFAFGSILFDLSDF